MLLFSFITAHNFLEVKENCRLFLIAYKYFVLSQDAILKYNAHYSKRWNFEALHSYFNEVTIAIREAAQHSLFTVILIDLEKSWIGTLKVLFSLWTYVDCVRDITPLEHTCHDVPPISLVIRF